MIGALWAELSDSIQVSRTSGLTMLSPALPVVSCACPHPRSPALLHGVVMGPPPRPRPRYRRYPRKQSSCALEVDANVADILNAHELVSPTQSLRTFSAESHGPLASGSSASSVARQDTSRPQLPRMDAVRSLGEIWEV